MIPTIRKIYCSKYLQYYHLLNPVGWHRLQEIRPSPILLYWDHNCSWCGSMLLSSEKDGWCCHQGRYIHPRIYGYTLRYTQYCQQHSAEVNRISRALNRLFCFSAMGTTGNFIQLPIGQPANVVIAGRAYHRLPRIDSGQHSIRWFLYDAEHNRNAAAQQFGIPSELVSETREMLLQQNRYINILRAAHIMVPDGPLAVRLDTPVAMVKWVL